MIKNCKMNWENEVHTFTFVTGGDIVTALDSLSDLMGSLDVLYKELLSEGEINGDISAEYKVKGSYGYTKVKAIK
jgi:hypothetical protein